MKEKSDAKDLKKALAELDELSRLDQDTRKLKYPVKKANAQRKRQKKKESPVEEPRKDKQEEDFVQSVPAPTDETTKHRDSDDSIQSVDNDREKEAEIGLRIEIDQLAEKAGTFVRDKEFDQAIECWEQILSLEPTNEPAKSKIQELIDQRDRLLKIESLLDEAAKSFRDGNHKDCIRLAEKILGIDEANESAWEWMSKSQGEVEKVEQVISLLQEGDTLLREFKFQNALEIWQKILELQPDHLEALEKIQTTTQQITLQIKADDLYQKALDKFETEAFQEAADDLRECLTCFPQHSDATVLAELIDEEIEKSHREEEEKVVEEVEVEKEVIEEDQVDLEPEEQTLEQIDETPEVVHDILPAEPPEPAHEVDLEPSKKKTGKILIPVVVIVVIAVISFAYFQTRRKQADEKAKFSENLMQARNLMDSGQYEESLNQIRMILGNYPENTVVMDLKQQNTGLMVNKALELCNGGEQEKGQHLLRIVLEHDPGNREVEQSLQNCIEEIPTPVETPAETPKNSPVPVDTPLPSATPRKIIPTPTPDPSKILNTRIEKLRQNANVHLQENDFANALTVLKDAESLKPNDAVTQQLIKQTQTRYGDDVKARAGTLLREAGYSECVALIRKYTESVPEDEEAVTMLQQAQEQLDIQTSLSSAQKAFDNNEFTKCFNQAESILNLDPGNPVAMDLIEKARGSKPVINVTEPMIIRVNEDGVTNKYLEFETRITGDRNIGKAIVQYGFSKGSLDKSLTIINDNDLFFTRLLINDVPNRVIVYRIIATTETGMETMTEVRTFKLPKR